MKKIFNIFLLPLIIQFLTGCIDNLVTPISLPKFETTALVLSEIESRGDYLNSSEFPAVRRALEVYNNLSEYDIIDVRSADKYNEGHIKSAVNISNNNLYDYVTTSSEGTKKFLIVSSTGQAAAYYTSLFRLYGLNNVYSLFFGMPSWNGDFSNLIEDKLQNNNIAPIYNNRPYPKPSFSNLPQLSKGESAAISDFYENRIKTLIEEGFDEESYGNVNNINSMDYQFFESLISDSETSKYMVVCFGNSDLYFLGQIGSFENPGHPMGAVLYKILYPVSELKSTAYLQTLRTEKTIVLYSFSGQLSAMGVAYLNILGYKSKSLLFGAHNMFYDRLITSPALAPFTYNKYLIKDLPYDK